MIDEKKLISLIVAVYNISEYLPRCIDSILAQTYRNLEIILVDDGSTDSSGVICDEYAAADQRIRVIHKANGGLSDARNAGLQAASGDYIGFVDGDDWIDPGMYGSMLRACMKTEAQIAVCRYRQIRGEASGMDETGRTVPPSGAVGTGRMVPLSRAEILEIYICGHPQYVIYNSVWSKLFAAEVVRGISFAVGKKSEDIMYTTMAFCNSNKCVYLDTPFYNYVLDRQGSIMNEALGERRFGHEIPFWREQADYLKNQGMKELAVKSQYYFYRRMLFYLVEFRENNQMADARRLVVMLRGEKKQIRYAYRQPWAATGDKVRMCLALTAPGLYYRVVKCYDQYIIPLRNKLSGRW